MNGNGQGRLGARARAGAVTAEYVLLAVLIAAAAVAAVAMFGRVLVTMFITAGESTTLREKTARENLEMRRGDRDEDAEFAKDYHDSMHEVQ